MTQNKTGGPAFPGPSFTQGGHANGHAMGMTLRDWFAGQAPSVPEIISWDDLAGPRPAHPYPYSGPALTHAQHMARETKNRREWIEWQARALAAWGLIYADAMLATREDTQ